MAIKPFVKDNPNELNRELFWQNMAVARALELSKIELKIEKKTTFEDLSFKMPEKIKVRLDKKS